MTEEFLRACFEGKIRQVEQILEKGMNLNCRDENGSTGLTLAASDGHIDVVKALLERGANISLANDDDETALILASKYGYDDVVKVLINHGASLDEVDKDGETALAKAIMANHNDVVEILLNNGANIEKADRDGYRPLMLAANTFVSTQILSLLIDRGADKNARNRRGKTALDLADEFRNHRAADILAGNSTRAESKFERERGGSDWKRAFFEENFRAMSFDNDSPPPEFD